jgi:transketolase
MHGEAMGNDEIAATRAHLGWTSPPFEIPADVRAAWDMREKGAQAEQEWLTRFAAYEREFPALAAELTRRIAGDLPEGFGDLITAYIGRTQSEGKALASRQSSQATLNAVGPALPELLGGSADLTPSNGTLRKDSAALTPESPGGNYVHYGVREFGMSAIMNGVAGHGGFIPYGGTFLTFSDYARNAVRMAALMRLQVVFVYTHDSIGLGEDGPTHQPIEQLASLRAVPNLLVIRPADANETAVAWRVAIETQDRPVALILTRQELPTLDRSRYASADGLRQGAYVLYDSPGRRPELILIATGSEVALILAAAGLLEHDGVAVRCVSMPSWELFDLLPENARNTVLPPDVPARLAVELGVSQGWDRYVGTQGQMVGIEHFGASAPAEVLLREFGFTAAAIHGRAKALLTPLSGKP